MNTVQAYVEKYGPVHGPRVFRIMERLASDDGSKYKRRRLIETLTGRPYRPRRASGA